MDYSIFTEQTMKKRLNELPMNLREILNSGTAMRTVQQIARIHYLDENRTIMLTQMVAFILLGFISLDELSLEISENMHLNYEHATALAKELKVRIFRPIKEDLENVYTPIAEGENFEREEEGYWGNRLETTNESESTNEGNRFETTNEGNRFKTTNESESTNEEIDKMDRPLILHTEKPLTEKRKGTEAKGFSLPMGFFKKKEMADGGEAVKVRVETGNESEVSKLSETSKQKGFVDDGKPFGEAQGKRVVHYSELRTQLTPYEGGDELINLDALRPQGISNPQFLISNEKNKDNKINKSDKSDMSDKSDKIDKPTVAPTVVQAEPRERTKGFWFFAENIPPKKVETSNENGIMSKENMMAGIKEVDIKGQAPLEISRPEVANATPKESGFLTGQAKVEGNTIDLR